ncbi:MAG: hypothetical protein ABI140_19545 [Jatrophihabitantaceae bacterium]
MPSELVLSLAIGPLQVQPVPREVMQSLQEANVRVSSTGPSGFDLKFAVSTRSAIMTDLLPNGYFDPPARVVISASLRGEQTVLIDGVITHHELAPSDEAGKSVLSIKGEDLTRMMDLIDLTGLSFPAMPTEARIALTIAKYLPLYGIVPLVMPSVLLDVSNPLEEIPSQHGTDLAYIKYLAALVGYTFYLQPGPVPGQSVAYWGPLLRTAIGFLPSPPPIAIDWDHRSNVESLQFSFDGFAATQWLVYIQDTTSHLVLPIPVPNVNPISPPLASKLPLPLKIKNMTGMDKYSPIQAVAIGLAAAAAEANVVTGQGSLDVTRYGAILNARTMIEVHGAGITYDGQYFVDSVSHSIKPGSYKQNFSLSRNSLLAKAGPPTQASPTPPPSAGRRAALPASPR